ncbi:GNAT family protein [Chitinivorax sp. B]|uniref:GNAT family N-acetyltransferase n=1 Tax=Chitinivorax sp. B TaxID=2502235 RepID=UPI002017D023|nr:GNAT family protein [Chitinivorax sp. B]
MIVIRPITPDDAQAYHALRQQLDHETHFMLYEPGERPGGVVEVRNELIALLAYPNQTVLVVAEDDRLVGFVSATGGVASRIHHRAYLVAGILKDYAGLGLGQRLFAALNEWAAQVGIHRLELTVMAHNQPAIALYQKAGFQIEGIKHHSFKIDGDYVDEYYMGKLLDVVPS